MISLLLGGGPPGPNNPAPLGMMEPPAALGSFFAVQQHFIDISNNRKLVFRVDSFADITRIAARLRRLDQFKRDPLAAIPEESLIEFCMLTSVSAREQILAPLNEA